MIDILSNPGLTRLMTIIKAAFLKKSDTVEADTVNIDSTPTAGSTNLVTSGGVKSYVDGVGTRVTAIEGKIPAQASSSNQVADKAFVNSLIQTAIPTQLSQLSDDTSHRTVTDSEKSTWNGKQSAITGISGYSASKNQVLANNLGTINWKEYVSVMTGTDAPVSSMGNDGDIYLQQ